MGGRGHVVKKHLRYPHPIPPKFRTMFFFPFPTLLFACSPKKKKHFLFPSLSPLQKKPHPPFTSSRFHKAQKKICRQQVYSRFSSFPACRLFFQSPPHCEKNCHPHLYLFFPHPPPKKNHINWRTGRKLFSKKKKNKNSKQAIPLFFLNPISFHLPLSCTQIPKQNSTKNKQHNTKTNKTNQHKSNSETAPILFLFSLHW